MFNPISGFRWIYDHHHRKKLQREDEIKEVQEIIEKIKTIPIILKVLIESKKPYYVEKIIECEEKLPMLECWSARSMTLKK